MRALDCARTLVLFSSHEQTTPLRRTSMHPPGSPVPKSFQKRPNMPHSCLRRPQIGPKEQKPQIGIGTKWNRMEHFSGQHKCHLCYARLTDGSYRTRLGTRVDHVLLRRVPMYADFPCNPSALRGAPKPAHSPRLPVSPANARNPSPASCIGPIAPLTSPIPVDTIPLAHGGGAPDGTD